MTSPVFETLSASPAVTALAGTPPRVFPGGHASPDIGYPYGTWIIVVGAPDNTLAGSPDFDAETIQLDAWGSTYAQAKAFGEACRAALAPVATVTSYSLPRRDDETGSFRYIIEADFILA